MTNALLSRGRGGIYFSFDFPSSGARLLLFYILVHNFGLPHSDARVAGTKP